MKKLSTTRSLATKVLIILALSWSLFLAFAFTGCAGGKHGCPGSRNFSGYSQAGFGKPLCPDPNCTYFSYWNNKGEILSCEKHSIEDYKEQDSVIWLPYKKEMTFGY